MKYWRLSVGTLILAVALPLCCGYYVVNGPKAVKATIGSSCTDGKGCETVTGSMCNPATGKGMCICNAGMIPNDNWESCVAADETVGGTCFNNVGCELLPNSNCSEATGKGMCFCNDGMIPNGDGKSCVAGDATVGSTCFNNIGCEKVTDSKCSAATGKGKCICNDGKIPNDDGKSCAAGAGSNCNGTDTCGDKYATCIDGKCQCKANYTQLEGVCRPGLHAECDDTDNKCIDSVAVCKNSTCECQDKYVEHENKCLAPYNMTCTPDDGCITARAQCTNNTQTMEWKCLCPKDTVYIEAHDKCSGIGSSCTPSSGCLDPAMECKESPDGVFTCQCRDGYEAAGDVCKETGHSVHVHVEVDVDVDI
ncbi:fibrillin-1-like isoform X2 [Ischnura elegans]|uniref:fibrillin-1-like isoform X2 n=1 Tax=Ischnura elegans TaxID=197161 RepID=UPI001ED877AD|nr:fibrillin-1-like isoform X2 [Ischnura elegans]